jgi:arsenite transporter
MSGETLAVSSRTSVERKTRRRPAIGIFERFLSVWVVLCIVVGITLGHWLPAPFQAIGGWRLPGSICRLLC